MAYTKGELSIWKDYWGETPEKLVAQLPHSCDEWVIGGPDEIKALIEDLQEALKELLSPKTDS